MKNYNNLLHDTLDPIWRANPEEKLKIARDIIHSDSSDELLSVLQEFGYIRNGSPCDVDSVAVRLVALQNIRDHMDSKLLWPPEQREHWVKDLCDSINLSTVEFWVLYRRWNNLPEETL